MHQGLCQSCTAICCSNVCAVKCQGLGSLRTRTDLVVHQIIDRINLCPVLCRVELHIAGTRELHAVQHAQDVSALIAYEAPLQLVDDQRSCASPPVAGRGCLIDLPAAMQGRG